MLLNSMGSLNLGSNQNSRNTPATEEEINHLPWINLTEQQWKVDQNSEDVQLPKWVIWIWDIELQTEALFMPWGHTVLMIYSILKYNLIF